MRNEVIDIIRTSIKVLFITALLVACSPKNDISDHIKEKLEPEMLEIAYDSETVSNIRVLNVDSESVYYYRVYKERENHEIVEKNKDGETVVFELSTRETIESLVRLEKTYYYTTFEMDETYEKARYRVYRYEGEDHEILAEGYGDLTMMPRIVMLEDHPHVLLQEAQDIKNLETNKNSTYFLDLHSQEIKFEIEKENEQEVFTIGHYLNMSSKEEFVFPLIREDGDALKSEIYHYNGQQLSVDTHNHIAISQVASYQNEEVYMYSVLTGSLMTKKLAYSFKGDFVKTDYDLSFFETVTMVEEGLVVYGQIGEHNAPITYYLLLIDEDGFLTVNPLDLFDNGNGQRISNGFINLDDSDYQKGIQRIYYVLD